MLYLTEATKNEEDEDKGESHEIEQFIQQMNELHLSSPPRFRSRRRKHYRRYKRKPLKECKQNYRQRVSNRNYFYRQKNDQESSCSEFIGYLEKNKNEGSIHENKKNVDDCHKIRFTIPRFYDHSMVGLRIMQEVVEEEEDEEKVKGNNDQGSNNQDHELPRTKGGLKTTGEFSKREKEKVIIELDVRIEGSFNGIGSGIIKMKQDIIDDDTSSGKDQETVLDEDDESFVDLKEKEKQVSRKSIKERNTYRSKETSLGKSGDESHDDLKRERRMISRRKNINKNTYEEKEWTSTISSDESYNNIEKIEVELSSEEFDEYIFRQCQRLEALNKKIEEEKKRYSRERKLRLKELEKEIAKAYRNRDRWEQKLSKLRKECKMLNAEEEVN